MLRGSRSLSMIRFWTAVVILGLFASLSFTPALATSGTGNQNPDITLVGSVMPNFVHRGQTETATASATNNTSGTLTVTAKLKVTDSTGAVLYSKSENFTIGAGQTITKSYSNTIPFYVPNGTYYAYLSVSDSKGASHIKVHFTVNG
jgi:hypothetical protein